MRTLLSGGGEDGSQVEELAQGGMGKHVVAVVDMVNVPGQAVKTDLHIDDEQQLRNASVIGLVWTRCCVLTVLFLCNRSHGVAEAILAIQSSHEPHGQPFVPSALTPKARSAVAAQAARLSFIPDRVFFLTLE
jgi:hypothetical protein